MPGGGSFDLAAIARNEILGVTATAEARIKETVSAYAQGEILKEVAGKHATQWAAQLGIRKTW